MKLHKAHSKISKIASSVEKIPWKVWTCFWETYPLYEIVGDSITFGSDYKTLPEMREGVEWLVDQLGGKVKWEDKGE